MNSSGRTITTTLVSGENDLSWDAGLVLQNAGIDIEKYVRGRYEEDSGTDEGLTPGFWKTHSEFGPAPLSGWPETGYNPTDSYEAIFGVDVQGSPSLLDAMNSGGGDLDALMRHSTAALLNASNPFVAYVYSQSEVISMTQAAISSGNYEITKDLFAVQNELGADLNEGTSVGTIVETINYDADTPDGPYIPIGGEAIFTYEVTNTGDVALSDVQVTDDRLADVTFVGGDTDNDGLLDVGETWTYTASETVVAGGTFVNTGTVTGADATGRILSDSDLAHYNTSFLTSSLGDRVWLDLDSDGIQDDDEAGVAGVTVNLLDSDGNVSASTITDADGYYLFVALEPGEYAIQVVAPDGTVFTGQNQGMDDGQDSDVDGNGVSELTTLTAGENDLSWDAGLVVNGGIDIEKLVRIESPGDLYEGAVCDEFGKAQELTFRYIDSSTVSNTQEGRAYIIEDGRADDDGVSYVIVSNKENPLDAKAKLYFAGEVAVGDDFVASTTNAGTDKFGSGTFIHFFDDNPFDNVGTNDLLQSAAYHTSCSKPIFLGDVIGDATLVGYTGENGTAPTTAAVIGADYDADTAAEAPVGSTGTDTAVFTYEVTNTGSTAISNVVVTDDRISEVTYVGGDDGDGLLEVGEVWTYTASESVASGLNTNIGFVSGEVLDINGQSTGVVVNDDDAANYVGTVAPPSIDVEKYVLVDGGGIPTEALVCETYGKAQELTLRYIDSSTVSNTQEGRAYIIDDGRADDDGVSYVIVSDKENPLDTGAKMYFAGEVAVGDDFVASAANAGADKFGSGTFIHFFDDNPFDNVGTNELLQSAAYHTSCSKPINLGDVVGDVTLVGYTGELGTANPVSGLGEDADTGPGPDADFGSDVVFNYVVTNTGSGALSNVQLTDDRIENLTFVGGDDGDGLLEVGEEWLYTATEKAEQGIIGNIGTVTATDAATGTINVTDADAAFYNGVMPNVGVDVEKYVLVDGGGIPTEALVCDTYGKAQELTLRYIDSSTVSNTQEGRAYIIDDGRVDDDGVSYVIVSDKENPWDTGGKMYFAGEVAVGDDFVASAANAGADKFGSGTFIHFFDDNPFDGVGTNELLQSAAYHTSCSKPINLGDVVGDVTLVGYTGELGTANPVSGLGEDADTGPGPDADFGSDVVFNYVVTNTGDVALSNVQLSDDRIENLTFVGGDDGDGLLEVGEEWLYTGTEKAEQGIIGNIGTVTATDAATRTINVTDADAAFYNGSAPGITLGDRVWFDKNCDGIQDDGENGAAGITVNLMNSVGDVITTTTTDVDGNYLFSDLTPGTYSVGFVAPNGYIFTHKDQAADDIDSDANENGQTAQYVLAAGENNLSVDAGLVEYTTKDASFNFNGSSSGAGTYGNVRSYTDNGVSVKVSAFSRDDGNGEWNTAYLGAFSGGLGVTNRGESGSGSSHTVDNNGQDDYVLFEFNEAVTVDSAYLGYVVNDSDMSVWIGTVDGAFDSHLTLSDSVLSAMGFTEISNTSSSGARLADLNADEQTGNILIIAAKTTDSNDYFKIQHLSVQVKESVCDSGECAPIIIEAEDMVRVNYSIESNSAASDGAVVKLSGSDGYVKTTFDGPSGNYDFTLNYIDENDGYGMLKIKINGTTVKTINLDQQVGDHKNGFASVTVEGLQLNAGDEIKVSGWKDSGEYARIDSIVLENCDTDTTPMNVAPEDGDESVTVSESDGRQTLATNALTNATDADGDSVFVKSLEGEDLTVGGDDWDVAVGSNGGRLYIYADGTVEFDTNGEFDYLNAGETATTSVTYVVSDGNGGENESTYKVVVNGESSLKASLGDRVWHDKDKDGYQDASESGISDVRLDLYSWNGSTDVWADYTYTNSNGDYSFNNLDEGYYYIRADKSTLPYGYEFTGKDWANDSADSDVNGGGYTNWILLDEGEQDNNWDVGAYYCPIVIDLDGNGIQTLSVDAGTRFDMDNDGVADSTGWISGSDAFIVHDANNNGLIDNRSEMFGGDKTGDGFRKLAAFDSNGDGVINALDDAFTQLQVWQDANENGITDAGELISLTDAGLAALNVQFETRVEGADTEQNGNRLLDWSTAEQADGSHVDLVDVYFAKGDSIDLSKVEGLESSGSAAQASLSYLDLGMAEQNEFAYEGVTDAFDALDIPDMAILGTADEQQVA